MSLITEQKKAHWKENLGSIVKRIEQKRPDIDKDYARQLAYCARMGLKEKVFPIVTNPKLGIDEMVEELEEVGEPYVYGTIEGIRYGLIAAGFAKRKRRKEYTKEELIKADQRFPDPDILRREIVPLLDNWISVGEIADKINIPKISTAHAKEGHGVDYRAYNRLSALLLGGVKKGCLERVKREECWHYKLISKEEDFLRASHTHRVPPYKVREVSEDELEGFEKTELRINSQYRLNIPWPYSHGEGNLEIAIKASERVFRWETTPGKNRTIPSAMRKKISVSEGGEVTVYLKKND